MCTVEEAIKEIRCVASLRGKQASLYIYICTDLIINISSTIEQMRSRTKQRHAPQILVFIYIILFIYLI